MPTYAIATEKDYENLLRLLREAADYLDRTLELMAISVDKFGQLFRTVGQIYTVRDGGELAGFYWIEKRENLLHLHGLILKERFRGKGIGTQILRRLEAVHRDDADAIELGVHESNTGAIKLYERHGYETVKTLDDLGFHVMQKPLSDEMPRT